MSLADWTQLLSELLVLVALTLTLLQLREANRQNRALFATFKYNGHATGKEDIRITFFRDDPELLSWYLRSRGYETSTPMEDRRRLYILTKLNLHETARRIYSASFVALVDEQIAMVGVVGTTTARA